MRYLDTLSALPALPGCRLGFIGTLLDMNNFIGLDDLTDSGSGTAGGEVMVLVQLQPQPVNHSQADDVPKMGRSNCRDIYGKLALAW